MNKIKSHRVRCSTNALIELTELVGNLTVAAMPDDADGKLVREAYKALKEAAYGASVKEA